MYNKIKAARTTLQVNNTYQAESLEKRLKRILTNKEPIKDGAQRIYTERKDGVQPQYNVRTDRFELAVEAMDKVGKSYLAKRAGTMAEQAKMNMETEAKTEQKKDGGAESLQGK